VVCVRGAGRWVSAGAKRWMSAGGWKASTQYVCGGWTFTSIGQLCMRTYICFFSLSFFCAGRDALIKNLGDKILAGFF